MWQQLILHKAALIGGTLIVYPDLVEQRCGFTVQSTPIKDVALTPNGSDGWWFEVQGEEFCCGGDTRVLGVLGGPGAKPGVLRLEGYGGSRFDVVYPVLLTAPEEVKD